MELKKKQTNKKRYNDSNFGTWFKENYTYVKSQTNVQL